MKIDFYASKAHKPESRTHRRHISIYHYLCLKKMDMIGSIVEVQRLYLAIRDGERAMMREHQLLRREFQVLLWLGGIYERTGGFVAPSAIHPLRGGLDEGLVYNALSVLLKRHFITRVREHRASRQGGAFMKISALYSLSPPGRALLKQYLDQVNERLSII